MKQLYNLLSVCAVSLLTACQGEAELQIQQPDGYDLIRFEVSGTQKNITRASSEYRAWDPGTDPSTMGVFGYYDMQSSNGTIFENTQFKRDEDIWVVAEENDEKHWIDEGIETATEFAFFAYMPCLTLATTEADGVKLEKNSSTYTLSMPYQIENIFRSESENTAEVNIHRSMPLICNEPGTKPESGPVPMKFDQTLAGFQLAFKLGEKMENVRDITIKKVRIYGENLPYKGVVSRRYTLASGSWSVGNITWTYTADDKKSMSKETTAPDGEIAAFVVKYTNTETNNTLPLNSTAFQQWGDVFYAIPAKANDFKPAIEVTYDVETNDSEGSVLTRKEVVSTIELNATNFKNYKGGEPDVITKLDILIVPSYLYVLADADQHAGVIVIQQNN